MACFYEGLDQFYLFFYNYNMEKLLQLLNEYEKVIWTDRVWWWAIDDGAFFCTRKSKKGNLIVQHSSEDEAILQIISKKFWFIQWLRSNCKTRDLEEEEYLETGGGWVYSEYESMLMFLAIQDDPISFLASILK